MRWRKTTKHIYAAITAEHGEQLAVFGSFSNPTGNNPIGRGYPEMETEWGFEGADFPLLRHTWKERGNGRENFYWLAIPEQDDE